ncbi:hypothetical protein PM10SUCC1_21020 [Propionigenium maris DSM 9537]|uniref:Uncharacterized protein n=1 Tax=Propionigenium maris DSM 9537 TaxID=1123000 RepID=A0A9W6GK35_9FUSO|nr:hypothetical protein [Propionigenium maris]GLI56588.1 hypothetical protein PM10SUCC1_21020 [Propionigenium maris DSM 9537]
MKRKIFKKVLLVFMGAIFFTGCNRISPVEGRGREDLQKEIPIKTSSEARTTYSYGETFELEEGGGFFSTPERANIIYTPEDSSGFITFKTKDKVKSILIRSRRRGNYVKLEKPVVITTSTGGSTTSFYLNEEELISLLKIIQEEDLSIKINTYSNYRIVKHRGRARNRNIAYASSFERVVEVSRKLSRS